MSSGVSERSNNRTLFLREFSHHGNKDAFSRPREVYKETTHRLGTPPSTRQSCMALVFSYNKNLY